MRFGSIRFTGSSPGGTATSGNIALSYNAIPVTGRIVGLELGSPAFDSATGSLYMFASGATWNNTRLVAQINGLAQDRTYYPITAFQRNNVQGTLLSGVAYSATEYPLVDAQQIGLATSGTFNGTAQFILYYE